MSDGEGRDAGEKAVASPLDPRLEARLRELLTRFDGVEVRLSDPALAREPDRIRALGRERAELEPAAEAARELLGLVRERAGAIELRDGATGGGDTDPEMRALAGSEVTRLDVEIAALQERVRGLLIPKDPLSDRAAVLEVRAGTGGDEAGLFASDLIRMYQRYAERRRWKIELVTLTEGIPGSAREAVFTIRGAGAYGTLRFESGVHRVQRVPSTESQGRIHTSAATVAVLPEAEEVDVVLDSSEIRVDVFRSSGPGGQSVNTTDSAVRVTHLPTGITASCQDEKSQHRNRQKAMNVLRSRILDLRIAEQEAARARDRRAQVGTGDRSAKIRTYNFPQNRVTDHRIGLTIHQLDAILEGELEELLDALRLAAEEERLAADSESADEAPGANR